MKQLLFPIFYFVLAAISLIACGQKEVKKNKVGSAVSSKQIAEIRYPIQLNLPEKGADTLKASFFAESVKYIPLETSKETFLRGIRKIQMNDSIIAVADSKRLLLFDYEGNFLRRIGKSGKGPGEYLDIFNFALSHDTLYISSSGKRSIIKYTLDGKFQKEIQLDDQLIYFSSTPDGHFVDYDRLKGTVRTLNNNFKAISSVSVEYNVSGKRMNYMIMHPEYLTYLSRNDKKVFFTNYVNDTIWDVSNGNKKAEIILNQSEKLLPWKYQVEYYNGDFEKQEEQSKPYQMFNLMQTSSYLFLFQKGWREPKLNFIYIHNKKNNSSLKFETPFIYDDLIGKIKLMPEYFSDDYLIATLNPMNLIEEMDKFNCTEAVFLKWKEKMKKVKAEDNLVLVLIKPKNEPTPKSKK